jgi:aldose 1-epimerase
MKITHSEGGSFPLVTLTNSVNFSLTLCDLGAAIYEMRWEGIPLTIAEKDLTKYVISSGYFGKTAGRIAGRVKKGLLDFRGKRFQLSVNEGKNSLHGGKEGLSSRLWKRDLVSSDGETYCDYYYFSPDGEMGYPGEVTFRVRYHLHENEPILEISYQYESPVATPVNLTTHTYFNLGGVSSIREHRLLVKSLETETYDSEMIPLGFRKSPACLDFHLGKTIGKDLYDPEIHDKATKGYDHCFRLSPHDANESVLTLANAGIVFELATDLPCVQIYSDNYPRPGALLTNGNEEGDNAAVAIEPVFEPGDFESMATVPNEFARHRIVYSFHKEVEP